MAIVIPSSKTYDRQNPKVRDNVIERIEVGAMEVVPDNEYETPVYNEDIDFNPTDLTNTPIENKDLQALMFYVSQSGVTGRIYSVSYVAFNNQKTLNVDIKIPVISNNKFINKIYTLLNEDEEPYIKYLIIGNKKTGIANAYWDYSAKDIISTSPYKFTVEEGEIIYNTPYNIEEDIVGMEFEKEISLVENKNEPTVGTSAKQQLKEWGNIKTEKPILIIIDGKEYYKLSLQIMAGVRTVCMKYSNYLNDGSTPTTIDLKGEYVSYEATSIEITLYGNTIGIDLQDKTVYINDETAKKVHSVEGNELMQTANYMVDKNGTKAKAIDKMYGDTQTDYAKGKETAKIRCSISDYYDGDQKVISIDNSTGKMSFDIGDQVIPMVYGADGKDRPMSTYQDGSAKEFEVLGKEKFYDGAVWQELSLQEIAKKIKKEPIQPLTAPYLEINGSILKINNTDQRATEFLILVDGNEMAKTTNDSFNLSLLNLPVGSYSITAKSKSFGLENSQESNQVIFVVVEENPDEPEIEKPFEIDTFIVDDGDYKYSVFDEYEPTIEEDEEGNKLFYYDTLALIISSNKASPSELLELEQGDKITIYPFDQNSAYYENSLDWIYRLTIEKAKNGAVISYKDIEGIERTIRFNNWNYSPITIEFYMDNGVGTIKITDKDGDGTTVTNVDFSMGVTILSN